MSISALGASTHGKMQKTGRSLKICNPWYAYFMLETYVSFERYGGFHMYPKGLKDV
jgi:hypothetical protein